MSSRHVSAAVASLLLVLPSLSAQEPGGDDSRLAEAKSFPIDSVCVGVVRGGSGSPFRVSVDGMNTDSTTGVLAGDRQRCQDLALQRHNIQVRRELLAVVPVLNVTAAADVAIRNRAVTFAGYANYHAWIVRREIRIFRDGVSTQGTPLAVTTVADSTMAFTWTADVAPEITTVQYVLRVYDAKGAFDETRPKRLAVVDRSRLTGDEESAARESRIGYGENSRLIANIEVAGGAVTVSGDSIAPETTVHVMGRPVPVGRNGRFAEQEILPMGPQVVSVSVAGPRGQRIDLYRDIIVRRQGWFSVAIADVTIGQNSVEGPAALVTGDDGRRYAGDSYASGRLAFYAKGQLGEGVQLTASADTREKSIGDLFSNFGRRDPRSLMRRLDPNTVYPEYGDDATLIVDAPTQGNAYLRLDRKDSHVMWGSFQTRLAGADLVSFSRGLYGGELQHQSQATTRFGERRTELTGFAADPGTIGSREEFRGTGGSLYYLRNQDLLLGSEHLRVEIRDRDSDIVLQSTPLLAGQDYELNALQGRITLMAALSSVADRPSGIRVGALDGNPVYLVVTYEFTPGLTRAQNLTTGGRASHWVGDNLRLGATGYRQGGEGMDQLLLGGDVTFRYAPGSYVRIERARSEGTGSGSQFSLNGGYDFTGISQVAEDDITAMASRVEMGVSLPEISGGRQNGKITAYWLDRGAGFSAPGQLTAESVEQVGVAADIAVSEQLALSAKADLRSGAVTGESRVMELGGSLGLSGELGLQLGVRHDYRGDFAVPVGSTMLPDGFGGRTDAIARLAWDPVNDEGTRRRYGLYGLVQGTVSRDDTRAANDRYGVGGRYRLNNRTTLSGEVTDGTAGTGGRAGVDYRVSDRSTLYLNYLVDVDRSDQGSRGRTGNLTTGGNIRFSDATSVFVERRQESSESGQAGLMHAFGLDIAASDRWSWGLKLEQGELSQGGSAQLHRRAASLSGGYRAEALRWGGVLEYRKEHGDGVGERESWLVKNTVSLQASPDWRLLARANLAVSDGNAIVGTNAEYTEIVAGLAYRPVLHNRFNGLFRYTFLHDLSSPGQLGSRLQMSPFAQRSHVVSADGIYALTGGFSLGAKVGYRVGEIRDNAVADAPWIDSKAWLAIVRADWRALRSWDLLAEIRSLTVSEAENAKSGILVGVYRRLNGNLKVGLGYNFTDYSDDLTDLSYRSRGLFINLIGQQ